MPGDWIKLCDWDAYARSIFVRCGTEEWTDSGPALAVDTGAHGFASIINGDLCAVYVREAVLFLVCGGKHIQISGETEGSVVVHKIGRMMRRVIVESCGTVIWNAQYPLKDAETRLTDPTFDALDDEMSDFWLWISRMLADPEWRSNAIREWAKGIKSC